MTRPVRLQLSRRKGFNLQELSRATNGLEAVNVARPGKWGNPWKVGVNYIDPHGGPARRFNAEGCVARFRTWLLGDGEKLRAARSELKGKNLACFCGQNEPCHADVLLAIANKAET